MAHIAVIDDSQATLDMLGSILRSAQHTVTALTHGVGAEETIASLSPDLVLLDIVMPERNGYEVLRGLRRDPGTKDIPVILVSSKAEDTDVRWGLRQGAKAYVILSPDCGAAASRASPTASTTGSIRT